MLTVSAKNLGPIAEGSVELKPLTIFVGPSNTGKSYMATAIWAIMQGFVRNSPSPGFRPGRRWRPAGSYRRRRAQRAHSVAGGFPDGEDPITVAFFNWVERLGEDAYERTGPFVVSELPQELQDELTRSVSRVLNSSSKDIVSQLRRTYGLDTEFTRHGDPSDFYLSVSRTQPQLFLDILLTDDTVSLSSAEFSDSDFSIPEEIVRRFQFTDDPEVRDLMASEVLSEVESSIFRNLFAGIPAESYYLPAARSGIAQGHKVLVASLIRRSSRIGIEEFNLPTLPGMATEFLGNLSMLDRGSRSRRTSDQLNEAIEFIENEVISGRIDLDESAGLPTPEIVYLPGPSDDPSGKYTLDHTSSMVSELGPVILFLKYLVNEGDLLIFEEPESHLHPAAQRQLARGIVRLVNAGIEVLITTHSDTFVSQINNLLVLSQASQEVINERGFAPADFVKPTQVSAYLFRNEPGIGGSKISQLEIDPDTGIDEEEFAQVFEAIYDESIALQRDRE